MKLLDRAPQRLWGEGGYAWGRYREPVAEPLIHKLGRGGSLRLKEWHYTSVVSPQWFVAFALVQLGYLANFFCYVVNRRSGEVKEHEALVPLGRALQFSRSSLSGTTAWRRRGERIEVRYGPRIEVTLDLPLGGKRLEGSFSCKTEQALALVFPLGPDRPAYTHKAAAMPATGALSFGGERIVLDDALATLDWTRSLALRTTKWKWASFATRISDGRRVGLNLSREVYDDPAEGSQENALWVDGVVYPLGEVHFEVPRNPSRESWRIVSERPGEVDLEFTPRGARRQNVNLGLLRSRFIQPYGEFRGALGANDLKGPLSIDGAFGVVEDHFSIW